MGELSMTEAERQAFLRDPHVGTLAVERADGPPLAVPIWYDYEPGGELWVVTDGGSLKARLIEAAGRFTMSVQEETAPLYAYVSVEGAATIRPTDADADLRPMAHRYFGQEQGDWYTDNAEHGPNPVRISMTPERWFTVDYRKMTLPDDAPTVGEG